MMTYPWASNPYGMPEKEPVEPPKGLVGVIEVKVGGKWTHPAPALISAQREFEKENGCIYVRQYGWVQAIKIESGLIRDAEGWRK